MPHMLISVSSPVVLLRAIVDGRSSPHLCVGHALHVESVGFPHVIEFHQKVKNVVIAGVGSLVELSEARIELRLVAEVVSVSVEHGRAVLAKLHIALAPFLESESAQLEEVHVQEVSLGADCRSLFGSLGHLEGRLGEERLRFGRSGICLCRSSTWTRMSLCEERVLFSYIVV